MSYNVAFHFPTDEQHDGCIQQVDYSYSLAHLHIGDGLSTRRHGGIGETARYRVVDIQHQYEIMGNDHGLRQHKLILTNVILADETRP